MYGSGLRPRRGTLARLAMLTVFAGCSPYEPPTIVFTDEEFDTGCSIPQSDLVLGASRDGIPALSDPAQVRTDHEGASYVEDGDRVVGIRAGFDEVAVPLGLLRWHEIVNLSVAGRPLVVTHCPLTGSSLAFDRAPLGGVEFGVSGLLYRSNLIMFDRGNDESLWPQMLRGARCGTRDGTPLTMYPAIETTWGAWKAMHPDTRVVSSDTGFENNYSISPYGDYDENEDLVFPIAVDPRRPMKERVLGLPEGEGGTAFPFGELGGLGEVGVVAHTSVAHGPLAVFWSDAGQAAIAFKPLAAGVDLSFRVENGEIRDDQTDSSWRMDGLATGGPLAGERLDPLAEAYIAFWFGWAAFHPATAVWTAPQ